MRAVTVDLPEVPDTATPGLAAFTTSARRAGRGTSSRPRRLAATTSGVSASTAVE